MSGFRVVGLEGLGFRAPEKKICQYKCTFESFHGCALYINNGILGFLGFGVVFFGHPGRFLSTGFFSVQGLGREAHVCGGLAF